MGEMHEMYGRWDENGEYNPLDGEPDDPYFGRLEDAYNRFIAGLELGRSEKEAIRTGAHQAVARAIEAGTLERPERCSRCRKRGRIEAHHASYAREAWLNIEWLCQSCHGRTHDRENVWRLIPQR